MIGEVQVWWMLLSTCFVCGSIAAAIAKRTGRDPLAWFIIGMVINVVAIAVLCYYARRKTHSQPFRSY